MESNTLPQIQEFHIPGVKHVLAVDAYEAFLAGDALLVDVREEIEISLESVDVEPTLIHPMLTILDSYRQLPMDKILLIICAHGERSTRVANLLLIQGYTMVYNIDGGLLAWKEAGLPMKGCGPSKCGGCGCGCGE